MRILIISALLGAASLPQAKAGYEQIRIEMLPKATQSAISIKQTGNYLGKIVWPTEKGIGYVIENRGDLRSPWRSFAMDAGTGQPMSRDVFLEEDQSFYASWQTSVLKPGETVTWQILLPDLSPSELRKTSAVWNFDEDEIRTVNAPHVDEPILKTYAEPGVKFVTVMITLPDQSTVEKDWAVTIGDEPVQPAPTNLIQNGDFETRDPSDPALPLGWHKGGYGENMRALTYPVTGLTGLGASAAIYAYNSGDAKWYFDDVAVLPNATYTYGDSYISSVTNNVTIQYRLKDGSLSYKFLTDLPPTAAWKTWSMSFTTPPNVASLTVFHSLTSSGTLTLDNVMLTGNQNTEPPVTVKGMVSFNFDDGWASTWLSVQAPLAKAGMKGTFFIVTGDVGLNGLVSVGDLNKMNNAGHEIGNHTVSHLDLTKLDSQTAAKEMRDSQNQLAAWGFNPSSFAYPYGSHNSSVEQIAQNLGFASARTTDQGFNDTRTGVYALKAWSLRNTTKLEDVKQRIDQAAADGTWLILVFHRVDNTVTDYSVSPAFFQSVVDYVNSKQLRVVTNSEGVRSLH